VSTDIREDDVIFGGEGALEDAIHTAQGEDIGGIFILNTCIVDTIGDDTAALCKKKWKVPVIFIPSSGFLGGGFNQGMMNALQTLAGEGKIQSQIPNAVNLIGEKNLEYEVDENFSEVSRLIGSLGGRVHIRFVHDIDIADLGEISRSALNILREPDIGPVGQLLSERFGTPFLDHFPVGFRGSLSFLKETALLLGLEYREALDREIAYQERVRDKFRDLNDIGITFGKGPLTPFLHEMMEILGLQHQKDGVLLSVPIPEPIGTKGVERLFHRWRRSIRASV
jgi:nitrogenase molybdenum-iron protein alpha/beta subunit